MVLAQPVNSCPSFAFPEELRPVLVHKENLCLLYARLAELWSLLECVASSRCHLCWCNWNWCHWR